MRYGEGAWGRLYQEVTSLQDSVGYGAIQHAHRGTNYYEAFADTVFFEGRYRTDFFGNARIYRRSGDTLTLVGVPPAPADSTFSRWLYWGPPPVESFDAGLRSVFPFRFGCR